MCMMCGLSERAPPCRGPDNDGCGDAAESTAYAKPHPLLPANEDEGCKGDERVWSSTGEEFCDTHNI